MRIFSLTAASLLAASLVPPTAVAQDLQHQPFDAQRTIRESHGITQADGQLLAIGGGIEASFETGRVVITPLLGSAARENMPMTLELDRILRGDETRIQVVGTAQPIVRTNQVDYRHGHGIVERYVSRPDGVKQSILIQQPIPGSGDLIVSMNVTTELGCAITERARQLDFDAGKLGGIHIGTVLGIDARGDRIEGYMRFDGQNLDLALPAAFVDRATYPIDVDPVLGGRIGTGRSFSDNEIDIAFDVKCCSVDALTGTTSSIVDIAATGLEETTPDVGGDSTLNAPVPQCICVWDEGTAVKSCVVELNTNPPTVTNIQTVLGGLPVDNPVITKDGGTNRRYFVALQPAPNAVAVFPLDSTGTVIGGAATVASSTTTTFGRPDIDGNGLHFTVVMQEFEQGSTTDSDIRASHGVWNGAAQLVDSFLIEADPGFDESRPCVALMNSKYVAA